MVHLTGKLSKEAYGVAQQPPSGIKSDPKQLLISQSAFTVADFQNQLYSWLTIARAGLLVTSAKEVMFLSDFVFCLFACLCVSKVTQKVMDGSF